jgi:hypothetical protein
VLVFLNVHNPNGSITRVRLIEKDGCYWGPQCEQYPELPREEQLRPYYGMKAAPVEAAVQDLSNESKTKAPKAIASGA